LANASTNFEVWLAIGKDIDDMERGRLVVDAPLANRVRSGRKQPQRASVRVIVLASHPLNIVPDIFDDGISISGQYG
jgi:hypothetical protein